MEKHFRIDYPFDWEYTREISKIRKDLDALEKLGATHIHIEKESDSHIISLNMYSSVKREETDEEFEERMEEYKRFTENKKNYELKLLEELKLKYESN